MINLKSIIKGNKQVHIAPLVVFRIVFGLMMFGAVLRFWGNGWIKSLYIDPDFYFPYLGFEWIKPLGDPGMYLVFAFMGLSALMIAFGLFFRFFAFSFFLLFTYVELIDKTPYLNHYYFICIVSFLLFLLPANKYFSLDVRFKLVKEATHVPLWMPVTIKLQLGLVYFFAGIAKIDSDWLFNAMPLKIWLPARADMPVLGGWFAQEWTAYLFSWIGLVFDLCIPFILLNNKFRVYGYLVVVVFHVLTYMLFNIGMFPFVMIGSTLIFFSESFHLKVIDVIKRIFRTAPKISKYNFISGNSFFYKSVKGFLVVYFLCQCLLPFRYALYPGNLFWTEQGFRFSWRVMLMEKSGNCTFYVCDKNRNEAIEINNRDYLTSFQEKMMSTQPDMILQFAHYLRDTYKGKPITVKGQTFNFDSPKVYVDSYVALNGRGSKRFIDPEVDLAKEEQSLRNKTWILPFEE
jgi:Vitamin K-dependent gamma-carboxylase